MHGIIFISSEIKGAGNTDSPDSIQAICILYNLQLNRVVAYLIPVFKRDITDNIYHLVYECRCCALLLQELCCNLWPQLLISVMEFSISNIM
ncbi:hypothetical protein D3C72_2104550 [compost metagenome]